MEYKGAESTAADFFLRDIPNVKIRNANVVKEGPKPLVKEDVLVLKMQDDTEQMVMDTLRYIHGDDFELSDLSNYEDKGMSFCTKYFQEKSNLMIKGAIDFSRRKDEPELEEERIKMFAIMRLESYGFHTNHCVQAMEYCNDDLQESLFLLYQKYFGIKNAVGSSGQSLYSKEELLEMREDEKLSIKSIYEDSFHEKEPNSVWIVKLKLDYLVKYYSSKKDIPKKQYKPDHKPKRKKESCRLFLQGHCKYGAKCRFSHESTQEDVNKQANGHLNNFIFELEIRFPPNTTYPNEPPIIFVKTDVVVPEMEMLHLAKRLLEEAELMAKDSIPCVYTLIDTLSNETLILDYLKNTKASFPRATDKLFADCVVSKKINNVPSHYQKGSTSRDTKKQISLSDLIAEDNRIASKQTKKQTNEKYIKMLESRKNLPIHSMKYEILNTVQSKQVVVISGETGCGKTTQVPQIFLDEWLNNYESNNEHLEIICTQPRRISAIRMAERVAEERIESIGDTVGYQIRLETKISKSTRLTFCTTGILLRRLEEDPLLSTVSHIIVDEVHERSEESDFLLSILKEMMDKRPTLKIILMSATLNAELFSEYFGIVPIVNVPGRTFPVDQLFLEDILQVCHYTIEENSEYARYMKHTTDVFNQKPELISSNPPPKHSIRDENLSFSQILCRYQGYSYTTCKNLMLMDPNKINYELIECILLWIVEGEHDYPKEGTILIFLPGLMEITTLYSLLKCSKEFSPRQDKYLLLPLHSSLTSEEQSAIFKKPKAGVRKIILSTNLAETSITINDCIFVIDSGKMKEKHFDSSRNMESLDTVWVTRANANQRKGRAGRVTSGLCIHLFTQNRFLHHMLGQPIPEIKRVPLERILLNIRTHRNFKHLSVYDVLNKIIEPPVKESIDSAVVRLQNIGAFDKDCNLTSLGAHLAALPVDVRIGKLLLMGAILGCVDDALTIAAALSDQSPFVSPFGLKEQAKEMKMRFSMGFSDHLTTLKAYKKFQEFNRRSYGASMNFCKENFLSRNTLLSMADTKNQYLELLVSIGFIPIHIKRRPASGQDHVLALTGPEFNVNNDNIPVLCSILCSALYPNIIKVLTKDPSNTITIVDGVPKKDNDRRLIFKTITEAVAIHPSSVNFTVRKFPSPFLVYQEKIKTSQIFVRDCTMVPPMPLLLFSGYDIDISIHNGLTYILLNNKWIVFRAEHHKVAEMIKMIRLELVTLLEEKIKDPLLNILTSDKGRRIIGTILNLISTSA